MKKVYLAIPYSHEDDEIMERRFRFATRMAGQAAKMDLIPFSPITHSHLMSEMNDLPTDWEFWEKQDIPFVDWADEMHVIRAKGWRESTGVQAEIEYAEETDTPWFEFNPVETNQIKLVGISGKKRSGKDTMADILVEEYGFERYALADPIKEAAKDIFLFSDEQLWGDRKEKVDEYWGVSPREVLQEMGTNFFREEFDNTVWLDSMERRLNLYLPELVVIPDVRFPNEVEWVQRRGGDVIRIDASGRLNQGGDHESETALDGYSGYDTVIDNNGSLGGFEEKVRHYAKKYTS